MAGHDEATSQIVQRNLIDVHDRIGFALSSGPNLENMVRPMLRAISPFPLRSALPPEVELFACARRMMTVCSVTTIHGLPNPFTEHPDYCDLSWLVSTYLPLSTGQGLQP